MERLFLTGFMGAGKTTVGRLLAKALQWDFVDLDQVIVSKAGISINDIFAKSGEAEFRRLEAEALRSIIARQRIVVATGGGIVTREENRRLMRASGVVVNLAVTAAGVLERLAHDNSRPLLSGTDRSAKITALLAERAAGYADADLVLETTDLPPQTIVKDILAWIQHHPS